MLALTLCAGIVIGFFVAIAAICGAAIWAMRKGVGI
jgi:uncharacterized protein YneF (UPF0154 family)